MTISFPGSPNIGDEFAGGGFTWTWNGSAWSKTAASGGADTQWIRLLTPVAKRVAIAAGIYRVTAYLQDYTSPASTVTWKTISNSQVQLQSGVLVDTDTGNNNNGFGYIVSIDEDGFLELANTTQGSVTNIEIQTLSVSNGLSPALVTYTQSGSFTIPQTLFAVLGIGGGGGGGASGNNTMGGSGGGSGRIALRTGSFGNVGDVRTFTIGAGGAGGIRGSNSPATDPTDGSAGGNTVVNGWFTATGGSGGIRGNVAANGGAGGSGGGGAGYGWPYQAGTGGSNGSAGGNGTGTTGGAGSNSTLPTWILPGSGGTGYGNTHRGGDGGGFYAGGGGGSGAGTGGGGVPGGAGTGYGGGGGGASRLNGIGTGGHGGNGADGAIILFVGWE